MYKNNLVSMQAATMFTSKVALKVLGRITEERIRFVKETSKEIMNVLSDINSKRMREVRGMGFMIGIDLGDKNGNPDQRYALELRNRLAGKGVVCTLTGENNNVLKITPPVTIPRGMLMKGISIISDELKKG